MTNHEIFLQAIKDRKVVKIKFDTESKGIIERDCISFDFGPSRRNLTVNPERYHFYDLNSPDGSHTLSILPEQLISIEITTQEFDPAIYVTWKPPYKWFVVRDWGIFS